MSVQTILAVALLTLVGLIAGIAIFVVNRLLPKEDESLQKAAEIKEYLPGADCGACGQPGCFAYAQAAAKDKEIVVKTPCRLLAQDEEGTKRLGEYLGFDIDTTQIGQKAVVHCTGDSPVIGAYGGITTCGAAVQVGGGFKECPYACLGFGDCAAVCPADAITIDAVRQVAVVDWERCIGCGMCVKTCPRSLIELIPADMPQYLGCNYLAAKDVAERKKCSVGCIHCRLCVKASEDGEVTWNDEKDLPFFDPEKKMVAAAAIEKCPRSIILKTSAYPQEEEVSSGGDQ